MNNESLIGVGSLASFVATGEAICALQSDSLTPSFLNSYSYYK